jgi:O-glycosyl hydrolase
MKVFRSPMEVPRPRTALAQVAEGPEPGQIRRKSRTAKTGFMECIRKTVSVLGIALFAMGMSHCGSSAASGEDAGPGVVGGVEGGASGEGGAAADANGPSSGDSSAATPEAGASVPSCPSPASDAGTPSTTLSAGPGAGAGGSLAITIDGTGTGRTFDGIGAISGGGGNTRLLYDYPEPYRSQVLDYLFKPGVGADLHILKVEIGGDMDSTDGSEESHMHTANDLGCNRGYEWWLMSEAKARNPAIKLYALSWGAPGWIGGGNFWSQDMINYLMKWLGCAKANGFTIDYIGGWNEKGYNKTWYENMHAALAGSGIKLVGADSGWDLTSDMASDPTFKAAIDIVGVHYPCYGGDGSQALSCTIESPYGNAPSLGRPLWASENGSQDLNTGAPAMIRAIVRGYLDAQLTSYINWPIVAAIPPGLPWETDGLIQANAPWSGWYEVGLQTWTTAQVTQFTKPGWSFIDSASGYLGGNNTNGGYVSLKAASGGDYSVILETTTANSPQTVSFTTKGGLSTGDVHIWQTNLGSSQGADYFVHAGDVTPSNGAFWVTLAPNMITTITTTTGQGKGTAVGAAPLAAILPYTESFEGYAVGTLAHYISDQSGAFDVEACGGGRAGQCLRQMAPIQPILWNTDEEPYNIFGTDDWANYNVGVDVMLEAPGSVEVLGRYTGRVYGKITQINAYLFSINDKGAWSIVRGDGASRTQLASGTVAALGTMTWHHLDFSLAGSMLTASVDGTKVGQAKDSTYIVGPPGLGVGLVSASWFNAQFDNLAVTPQGPPATGLSDNLVNQASGLTLDVTGRSTAEGALLEQAPASGATSQVWQLAGDRSGYTVLLNENSGKAIGAPSGVAGGAIDQETPDGEAAQHWTLEPAGNSLYRLVSPGGLAVAAASSGNSVALAPLDCTSSAQQWKLTVAFEVGHFYGLMNRQTGWLIDVNMQSTTNGVSVIQWAADNGTNQEWSFAPATGGGYNLYNGNSNLVLDVSSGGADQATPSGAPSQTWTMTPGATAGYFTLTSGGGGVLGSPSSSKGAQLSVGAATGGAAQEWMLVAPVP